MNTSLRRINSETSRRLEQAEVVETPGTACPGSSTKRALITAEGDAAPPRRRAPRDRRRGRRAWPRGAAAACEGGPSRRRAARPHPVRRPRCMEELPIEARCDLRHRHAVQLGDDVAKPVGLREQGLSGHRPIGQQRPIGSGAAWRGEQRFIVLHVVGARDAPGARAASLASSSTDGYSVATATSAPATASSSEESLTPGKAGVAAVGRRTVRPRFRRALPPSSSESTGTQILASPPSSRRPRASCTSECDPPDPSGGSPGSR